MELVKKYATLVEENLLENSCEGPVLKRVNKSHHVDKNSTDNN